MKKNIFLIGFMVLAVILSFAVFPAPAQQNLEKLLPAFDPARIRPVGNAAGTGAQVALLSLPAREAAEEIARRVEYIELAKHPDFQKEFIDGMAFP